MLFRMVADPRLLAKKKRSAFNINDNPKNLISAPLSTVDVAEGVGKAIAWKFISERRKRSRDAPPLS